MATPLIKPLQVQGGTLYAFSSSAKDITQTFNNSGLKFTFSQFACLNIPDIKTPLANTNNVQFDTIDGAILQASNLTDNNITLAEHFQNYVLNLESLLLENTNYNINLKQTVSERVFFKWLKELGAIRFRSATGYETSLQRFTEEDNASTGSYQYSKVVKYISDVKVINNVKKSGETYSEIYININTSDGTTPTVLFNVVEDGNYYPSNVITGSSEFISGRDSNSVHPAGLSMQAFYDYDDNITYTGQNALWMGTSPTTNSYFTEPNTFLNPNNDLIIKNFTDYGLSSGQVTYLRSKLDGITIDFNENNYKQITDSTTLSTINDFNRSGNSQDFEFNVILVYYDLYDVNTPNDRTTNLYGVLFLDNIENTVSDGSNIRRFKKYKFNPITKLNGNSYGLKINLKFDSSLENTLIETVINDYESYSLNLFSDVLTELKDSTTYFSNSNLQLLQSINAINDLNSKAYTLSDFEVWKNRVTSLEQSFSNANLIVGDLQSIFDSISSVNIKINDILNSKTPLTLDFNFNNVDFSTGLKAYQPSGSSKLFVTNTIQKYNNINKTLLTVGIGNNNEFNLKQFTNLFIFNNTGSLALNDIIININDATNKWEVGQTIEINFTGSIDMNNFNVIFNTDKPNRIGNGIYGTNLGKIMYADFVNNSKWQIICLDAFSYDFLIERLK